MSSDKKKMKSEMKSTAKTTVTTNGPAKASKPAAKASKRAAKTMTVAELMTKDVQVCVATDVLATAAQKLWAGDCGALPVVDEHAQPCGWITDRDICMALSMQPARATELRVDQVMNAPVITCRVTDPIKTALARFQDRQIRRLAIVGEDDRVVGVLSLNDLIRAATSRATGGAPSVSEVFETLKVVSRPHAAELARS